MRRARVLAGSEQVTGCAGADVNGKLPVTRVAERNVITVVLFVDSIISK